MLGRSARAIDLPTKRYNTRVVSHGFSRGLPGAIGDRRPHYQVIESAPFGERKLEGPKQHAEECYGSLTGQFTRLVSEIRRNCGQPSLGRPWRDRRLPYPKRTG